MDPPRADTGGGALMDSTAISVAALPGGLETTVRRIGMNVVAAHAGMVQLAQTELTRTHAYARQGSADKTVL